MSGDAVHVPVVQKKVNTILRQKRRERTCGVDEGGGGGGQNVIDYGGNNNNNIDCANDVKVQCGRSSSGSL